MVGDGMNVEELRYTNNFWRVSASKRAEKAPVGPASVPEGAGGEGTLRYPIGRDEAEGYLGVGTVGALSRPWDRDYLRRLSETSVPRILVTEYLILILILSDHLFHLPCLTEETNNGWQNDPMRMIQLRLIATAQ